MDVTIDGKNIEIQAKGGKNAKQPKQETLKSDKLRDNAKQGNIGRQMDCDTPKTICKWHRIHYSNLQNQRYH